MNGEYEEYPSEYGVDGSVHSRSELPGVAFAWDGRQEFDVPDPATGQTM